jgi:D-arabinose 1-dehydrogenase-like Zn-dependent alcohol dehydrogenase
LFALFQQRPEGINIASTGSSSGSTAVVIETGGLGQMAIQVLKALTGATTVIAFDTSARKLEIAKKSGATRHCSAATRLVTRTIVVIPLADDMHRVQH